MRSSSRTRRWGQHLLVAALLALFAAPAFAQKFTASIRGTVTDASKAVVAGAKVTLKNEETGLTRTMETNKDGNYSFPDIPLGSYRVEVEYTGFATAVRTKVGLSVAEVRAVDFQLTTGAITDTVSVEASGSGVSTVGAEVAGSISGETAVQLPLNGRNFMQLTLLQPGVTSQEGMDMVNKGLQGGSDISVSGGSTTSNLWLVDGADNVDHGSNRTILVYPSVDAIEEFKIQRNNYGAEFGQAGGAQVNLVTKGGTNTFHGTGYYFMRRDSLNSTDYFLEQANQPKAPLKFDDFGGTFGGPIIKDKVHFFGSYEKTNDARSSVRSGQVPTAAERAGDFSGVREPCAPPIPNDPLTGQPFPGNRIPADRLNPAGVAFAALYQLPNATPSSGCNNYTAAVAAPVNWYQIHGRLDWSVNDSTRLMVRYTQDSWKADNTILWGDSPTSNIGSNWDQPGKSLVAQLNNNIGSNMTNALTFSYSANKITATRTGDTGLVDTLNTLIPTTFPSSIKEQKGTASPWTWGTGPYGNLWNQSPWKNNQDLYVIKDDWSAVFGKHFVKAGAFYSSNAKNEEVNNTSQGDSVQLNGTAGFLTPSGYRPGLNTGNALADLLLAGSVFNTNESVTNPYVQQRWHDLEFYISDSYKLSQRVTADFGVRMSHMQPPFMADDKMGNFVPAAVNPSLGNAACNGIEYPPGTNPCPALNLQGGSDGPNRSLIPIKSLWFAPRLGLAWDVNGDGKTAIRAGVGRFYQRDRVSPGLGVGTTPPFSGTINTVRILNDATPVTGGVAPGYGAPSNALDQVAANTNYWQWNVAFQKEVLRKTTVELAYVGSKGMDLFGQTNLNEIAPANRLAYAQTGSAAYCPLNGTANAGCNTLALWQHNRDSIYHSLQTNVTSRWGQGSQISLSYTFAKLLANTGVANADGPGLSGNNAYIDSTQGSLDRARGGNDLTHVFSASLVLALPKLENESGFVKNVFGDWEVTSIVQATTGYPLTVGTGGVPGLQGGNTFASGTNNAISMPNIVPGQSCTASTSDPTQWLNPAAWTLNGYAIGTNGNSSRSVCDGPGFFQADGSLYKNIKLSDRVKLQLRFEVYNIFNNVNYLGSSMTNGGVNTQYTAQNVVFNADRSQIVSASPAANFGQLTADRNPRTMQLGIRLAF